MSGRRHEAARVARGGAYLFLVTLLASGAAFLTSMYLARALGPRDFGPYSTAYFLSCCLGVVAAAGFPVVLTREVAALRARGDEARASARYLQAVRAARRHAALAVALVVAGAMPLLGSGDGPALGIAFLLLSGTILPLATSAVRRADLSAREAYRDIAISTAIAAPLGLLFTMAAVGVGFGIAGAGVAAVLAATLQTLLLGAARTRRAEAAAEKSAQLAIAAGDPAAARAARRCLAIQAIDLVVWQRSELLFLAILLPGSAEAGYYGAAFSLSTAAMALAPGALGGALLPAVAAIHASGSADDLRHSYVRALRGLALLTLPILAGGLVLAGPLVGAAFGSAYAEGAAAPFRIALVGGAFGALGAASSSILYAIGGEGFILKMGVCLAVFNLALDVILIPAHGAVGAAIANSATQAIAVTIGTAFVAKRVVNAFPGLGAIARIAGATLGMTAILLVLGDPQPGVLPLLLRVAAGGAAYAVLVLLMGALDPADKALAGEIFRKLTRRSPPRRPPARRTGAERAERRDRTDPPVGMPTA